MKESARIKSFPPIIDGQSEVLILGSIPGAKSLEMQQYYAHPQNQFWKIISQLTEEKFTTDYSERLAILKKHHIALWDVIDSCERKGSLDSAIINEEANEIKELLIQHPNIKAIFCNGQKSHKNLQKILGRDFPVPVYLLPSTSQLDTVGLDAKLEVWKSIKPFLSLH